MITKKISKALLSWYHQTRRDLPWRRSRDPYAIWISEIMLQQTQVDTVLPYFEKWMQRFPTARKLAAAHEDEVVKMWEGLGYYSRARNLHRAAKIVVEQHQGKLPATPEDLAKLPGIGPYTLGALLSIAFDQPAPAVDGNVLRVFSRLFAIRENIKEKNTVEKVRRLATELYPPTQRSEMAQAWMELGALVCLPANPRCLKCPLHAFCAARKQGLTGELPVVDKRPKVQKIETAAVLIRKNGSVLLEKRPLGKIMGGLWTFPTVKLSKKKWSAGELAPLFEEHLGFSLRVKNRLASFSHSYTVYRANLHVFAAETAGAQKLKLEMSWISVGELNKIPFPAVHAKIARQLLSADVNEGGRNIS